MTMPPTVNAQAMIELGKKILKKYSGTKTIYWVGGVSATVRTRVESGGTMLALHEECCYGQLRANG